jgi:ATP-dependent DNA helicase RecG
MVTLGSNDQARWEADASSQSIEDLDAAEIQSVVSEAIHIGRLRPSLRRSPFEMLDDLGLLTESGKPTNAAAVLFGRRGPLERHFPTSRLRIAIGAGATASAPMIGHHEVVGNVFELFRFTDRFMLEHLLAVDDVPEVPVSAVREAALNALVHRDYMDGVVAIAVFDDRVEVASPGQLRFGITGHSLYEPHAARSPNPMIARAVYRSGLVRSWGSGFDRMARECRAAGLGQPLVAESAGSVVVTFVRRELASTHLG